MSRSGYQDQLDDFALARWRGAVLRASVGKRGQRLFRDLIAALDAMPEKVLIAGDFLHPDGGCCALGAVGLYRGISRETLMVLDPEETDQITKTFNISNALARETVFQNDEVGLYASLHGETPAQRWVRMRAWATDNIRKDA